MQEGHLLEKYEEEQDVPFFWFHSPREFCVRTRSLLPALSDQVIYREHHSLCCSQLACLDTAVRERLISDTCHSWLTAVVIVTALLRPCVVSQKQGSQSRSDDRD